MADSTFDFTRSPQATLTTRLSTDAFIHAIRPESDVPELYTDLTPTLRHTSMTVNVKERILTHEYLKHTYRRLCFLMPQAPGTPVPLELFEDEQAETLYYGCFPRETNQQVLYAVVPQCSLVWLFAVDKAACLLLKDSYPQAAITPSAVPLLNFMHTHSLPDGRRKLYAYVHETQMDVYAFEQGRFLFTNTFRRLQSEDLTYYLLYIWQQLGFDQQTDECLFIDDTRRHGAVLDTLQRYIRHAGRLTGEQAFGQTAFSRVHPPLPFDLQTSLITDF